MTDAQIGKEIDAAQSIVTRLRNGTHKQTYYDRAKKIENLARRKGLDDFINANNDASSF